MDLVEEFIGRYVREYDFYDHAARMVAETLESNLRTAGIRSIVTSRAKNPGRLQDKCRQRAAEKRYQTVDDIYQDIVDLAGVRVALYFPGDRDEVDGVIRRIFKNSTVRIFSGSDDRRTYGGRFSGYWATHYRIGLLERDLGEAEKRYAGASVEVQVASVLMHAWSEVEHDLIYKPLAGELSLEEYAGLDQLNGLVLAGELALEGIQRAGQARVATAGREFSSHYDLAVYLLARGADLIEEPISDSGLGRVDLLFALLKDLDSITPEVVAPYLQRLHGDLERRPLADQIIDYLLSENPDRYKLYSSLRREAGISTDAREGDQNTAHAIGAFMERWIEVERLLRQRALEQGLDARTALTASLFRKLGLDEETQWSLNQLRRLRNNLVHGIEMPPNYLLIEASQELARLIVELRRDPLSE